MFLFSKLGGVVGAIHGICSSNFSQIEADVSTENGPLNIIVKWILPKTKHYMLEYESGVKQKAKSIFSV